MRGGLIYWTHFGSFFGSFFAFSNHFSYGFNFSGAVSFCRRAALKDSVRFGLQNGASKLSLQVLVVLSSPKNVLSNSLKRKGGVFLGGWDWFQPVVYNGETTSSEPKVATAPAQKLIRGFFCPKTLVHTTLPPQTEGIRQGSFSPRAQNTGTSKHRGN